MKPGLSAFIVLLNFSLLVGAYWNTAAFSEEGTIANYLPLPRDLPQTPNCNKINWAVWNPIRGRNATGTINDKGVRVNLSAKSTFEFTPSQRIYGHERFSRYPSPMPNSSTPTCTWTHDAGGKVTMCFSKSVKDPVLMVASLGRGNVNDRVTLKFSRPYSVVYDGGGMTYHNNSALTGMEGYAILRFKGDITCITIVSSKFEQYTYLTWGLPACDKPIEPPKKDLKKEIKPIIAKPVAKPEPKKRISIAEVPRPKPTPVKRAISTTFPTVKPPGSVLTERSLKVQIWDFDCMDYDSVSLKFNGKPVGPAAILLPLYKRDAGDYTYILEPQAGKNTFEIHAISVGIKPFLSIGLLIMYHDKREKLYYKLKAGETIKIEL